MTAGCRAGKDGEPGTADPRVQAAEAKRLHHALPPASGFGPGQEGYCISHVPSGRRSDIVLLNRLSTEQ